ncbi:MAG: class III extradiol ring-cleavage dioxygenase [Pseudomonadota bacterium]
MPPAATAPLTTRLPSLYIPHGGGPCFFMDDPNGTWTGMAQFLRELPATLPMRPRAILIVSGHWETSGFMLTANPRPPLLFDYYGFPPHTYQLRYDAPGDPHLAQRAAQLLREAGFSAALDTQRGLDHGVFVPLKVMYPQADIPVVELSLERGLAAESHIEAGHALAPLRDEGVLLLSAGMSFHNLRALGDARARIPAQQFDAWLDHATSLPGNERTQQLLHWEQAPAARICHPRAEHLLPLMVAAGASQRPGKRIFNEEVLATNISGFRFE